MQLKLKFSINDFAYLVSGDNISRILIKSIETKTTLKSETEVKYISSDNKEYMEKDLISKRELIDLLGSNEY